MSLREILLLLCIFSKAQESIIEANVVIKKKIKPCFDFVNVSGKCFRKFSFGS